MQPSHWELYLYLTIYISLTLLLHCHYYDELIFWKLHAQASDLHFVLQELLQYSSKDRLQPKTVWIIYLKIFSLLFLPRKKLWSFSNPNQVPVLNKFHPFLHSFEKLSTFCKGVGPTLWWEIQLWINRLSFVSSADCWLFEL